MTRTLKLMILIGLTIASAPGPRALAQSYPDRTVTIVVTSAAGALTDVLTRFLEAQAALTPAEVSG